MTLVRPPIPQPDTVTNDGDFLTFEGGLLSWSDGTEKFTPKARLPLNVLDPEWGVVGDGVTDDSAALQACIDACLSAGNPVSVRRNALRAMYIPGGGGKRFRLNTPLRITSTLDFHLVMGAGCAFVPGATGMECLVDVNGAAYGRFEGLKFWGDGSSNYCTRALWHRWNGTASSSGHCVFRDCWIGNGLEFRRGGIEIGDAAAGSVDVSCSNWINCSSFGFRTVGSGEATKWQAAWYVGDGLAGNNLIHTFHGCHAAFCRYGVKNDASQLSWFGGQVQNNDTDFYHTGNRYFHVAGVRSENSRRWLETGGPASYAAMATFESCEFNGNNLHADKRAIIWTLGGELNLDNMMFGFAYDAPTIYAALGAGYARIRGTLFGATPVATVVDTAGNGRVTLDLDYVLSSAGGASLGVYHLPIDPSVRTVGNTTFDRDSGSLNDTAVAQTSGDLILTYFTAQNTETEATVNLWTGTTVAAATPTLVRIGIYSVNAAGDLTLIGSTANDTTLFAAGTTKYTKSFTVPTPLVKGARYAVGIIIVSGAALPSFIGRLNSQASVVDGILAADPRKTGRVGGQTDLPASVGNGSVSSTRRNTYAELLP